MKVKDLLKPVFQESVKCESGLLLSAPKGKMNGIMCLTSSAWENENCRKRAMIDGSICSECYSLKTLEQRGNVRDAYAYNTELLSDIISDMDLLDIKSTIEYFGQKYFRFESHGDLTNLVHLLNFFRIAKDNLTVNFSLWTKEIMILKNCEKLFQRTGLKEYEKPQNMRIIGSSLFLNDNNIIKCSYIDNVFTVYTYDYIVENDITINCGSRSCMDCLRCYSNENIGKDTYYINECLKSDINHLEKYYAMLKREPVTYNITYHVEGCKGRYMLTSRWNYKDKFERSQIIKELATALSYEVGYIDNVNNLYNVRITIAK